MSAFTRDTIGEGFRSSVSLGIAVSVYGAVLGVTANGNGMSTLEMLLMSTLVFAGASQFVAADMWGAKLPLAEIVIATMAVNSRYLLIGASLKPVFRQMKFWEKASGMHLVADENWAMTMAEMKKRGSITPGYLLGGGLCLYSFWQAGSAIGHIAGSVITNPEVLGVDFAFIAAFIFLTVVLWRDKHDILPWLIAAGTAYGSSLIVDGKWFIIIGSLCGFAAVVIQEKFWTSETADHPEALEKVAIDV